MNDLFYVLQETGLNNEELYLPPDTPFGKTNPRRLKALLKKRHARQRERLLHQQVAELDEYRRNFTKNNKDDLFITQTETACELMSGPDFLIECNDQIMELLSMIPLIDNKAEKDTEMSERMDTVVPEEKTLAPPPPSLPSDTDMDTSEEEGESLNDASQDVAGDDDEAIQDRKMKYSAIIKKKYKKGFSRLRKLHKAQLKKLLKLQKKDLEAIVEETPPIEVQAVEAEKDISLATSKEQNYRSKGKGRHREHEGGRVVNEQQREALSSAQQTAQHLLRTMNCKNKNSDFNKTQTAEGSMSRNNHPQPRSHNNTILDIATASRPSAAASPKPPIVASSAPPTVESSKPPIVATARPLTVATAGTPAIASNNRNNGKKRKMQKGRRDSNQPLFDTRPITFKPSTLLGDSDGSIYIRNKPDRVIINGQDFGSPKDFDDAINGIQRDDNSILRRHLCGNTYLYFKANTGQYVALGKVSRIQPFIHKFLLSR
ncbi:hypothetical protein PS15m_010348 [Mucor circinelloides]